MSFAQVFDLASVFVFALSGALVASRAQLDIVGFLFIACLTAVGGGTVRDVLLRREEVFWITDPSYLGLACAAAVLVFFTAHLIEQRYRAILWLDAVALSAAVAAGVAVAVSLDASWPVVLVMGVATGCLGGLMRDVVCNEVPLVLKQGELYAAAAAGGALAGVLTPELGGGRPLSFVACVAVTFALRAGSLGFGWRLPVYKPRPPRTLPPRR